MTTIYISLQKFIKRSEWSLEKLTLAPFTRTEHIARDRNVALPANSWKSSRKLLVLKEGLLGAKGSFFPHLRSFAYGAFREDFQWSNAFDYLWIPE